MNFAESLDGVVTYPELGVSVTMPGGSDPPDLLEVAALRCLAQWDPDFGGSAEVTTLEGRTYRRTGATLSVHYPGDDVAWRVFTDAFRRKP